MASYVYIIKSKNKNHKKFINQNQCIMKKLKLIFTTLFVIFFFAQCEKPCTRTCSNGGIVNSKCGCDCPNGYTGENCQIAPIPSCSSMHTAKVTFRNNSIYHYTYDIVWDGSVIATVLYGKVSNVFVVSTGTHTLKFKIYGTSNYACTSSSPNLAECSSQEFSCGG